MDRLLEESPPSTVFALLARASASNGDAVAITYGGNTTTFADLHDLSCRAAAGLQNLGIGAGDRVAFWLPNTVAYVALYFACAQLGAIAVAVNTRYRAKEVADIVGRSGAKTLILWPDFRNIPFLEILEEVPGAALAQLESVVVYSETTSTFSLPQSLVDKTLTTWGTLLTHEPHVMDVGGPQVPCNMFTTSGTTSAPKFVLHRQRSIISHAVDLWSNVAPLVGDGALLQALPFCGVFGFTTVILAIAGAVPMVITSAFDAAEAVELIDTHNVRYFNATDDMIMAMLAADPRDHALPGLACCGYGAFNASPEEMEKRASARGVNLIGLYGMSEVMALFARRAPSDDPATRCLGGGTLISPHASVRVRDNNTGMLLPHNTPGELEISGPGLMSEYFENATATAAALTEDGYLRTGDLGYTTADNTFVYLTRMGDTLRLGGFLVSPVEIESHLAEHPSVAGAQVVAVRVGDATRPFAFVVPTPGEAISEAQLGEHCVAALARFKVPVRFVTLDAFPTTEGPNGTKIQRARLREMAESQVDASSTT